MTNYYAIPIQAITLGKNHTEVCSFSESFTKCRASKNILTPPLLLPNSSLWTNKIVGSGLNKVFHSNVFSFQFHSRFATEQLHLV